MNFKFEFYFVVIQIINLFIAIISLTVHYHGVLKGFDISLHVIVFILKSFKINFLVFQLHRKNVDIIWFTLETLLLLHLFYLVKKWFTFLLSCLDVLYILQIIFQKFLGKISGLLNGMFDLFLFFSYLISIVIKYVLETEIKNRN